MSELESRYIKSARKDHYCDACGTPSIRKGDSYFRYTGVSYKHIFHYRECQCCSAFYRAYPEDCLELRNEGGLYYTAHELYAEFAAEFAINKMLAE